MIAFIDDHGKAHGVELISKVLPVGPSTYHNHVAKRADTEKLSARAKLASEQDGACELRSRRSRTGAA